MVVFGSSWDLHCIQALNTPAPIDVMCDGILIVVRVANLTKNTCSPIIMMEVSKMTSPRDNGNLNK